MRTSRLVDLTRRAKIHITDEREVNSVAILSKLSGLVLKLSPQNLEALLHKGVVFSQYFHVFWDSSSA